MKRYTYPRPANTTPPFLVCHVSPRSSPVTLSLIKTHIDQKTLCYDPKNEGVSVIYSLHSDKITFIIARATSTADANSNTDRSYRKDHHYPGANEAQPVLRGGHNRQTKKNSARALSMRPPPREVPPRGHASYTCHVSKRLGSHRGFQTIIQIY